MVSTSHGCVTDLQNSSSCKAETLYPVHNDSCRSIFYVATRVHVHTHTLTLARSTDGRISQNVTCSHYIGHTHSDIFLYSIIHLFLFYAILIPFLFYSILYFWKCQSRTHNSCQYTLAGFTPVLWQALQEIADENTNNHVTRQSQVWGTRQREGRMFWRIPRREETHWVSKIMKGHFGGGRYQKSTSKSQWGFNCE